MLASDKLNIEDEQMLKELNEALNKVGPAIASIIKQKDSGEVTLYFHEGKFKRAVKKVTV